MPGGQAGLLDPFSAAWTVARFEDYETAQRAAGRLSDDGFPAGKPGIAGSGLRLAERVTGRLTRGRAAGAGALSGMWAGLLSSVRQLVATRYDLIAREGTVDRAQSMPGEAGLLPAAPAAEAAR
jgi:hypothetical protein